MKKALSNARSPATAAGVSFVKKLCLSPLITRGAWSEASADTTIDEPQRSGTRRACTH
ncbi:MAG: hypothetical protein ABL974_00835 [Prosthecobacter sp.]